MIHIYSHQGLGDHIICNGMVRHYAQIDKVVIFCKKINYKNVSFMYRDNSNITILMFNNDDDIKKYINKLQLQCKIVGHSKEYWNLLEDNSCKLSFDELFYHMANLDFQIRFDEFYIERNLEEENSAYALSNPLDEPYIYIHDNPKLNFVIDKNKHRGDLKIIYNQTQVYLFNMRKILENATEIHTMQTSMFDFVNSIKLNCSIFLHTYVRNYPEKYVSKGLNNYEIIT